MWIKFHVVCLLFLAIFLAYDLYHQDWKIFLRVANETEAMEDVLGRMPRCPGESNAQQWALFKTLQLWIHLAHPNRIRYWISHNSVIGNAHFHHSLPRATTIDLSILVEETPDLMKLINITIPPDYEFHIHPQWNISNMSKRRQFPASGIDFTMYNARLINRRDNVSINIWPTYSIDNSEHILVQYDSQGRTTMLPEDWIFPIHPCFFNGLKVWCPSQSKLLAAYIYRSAWEQIFLLNCTNNTQHS